MYAHLLLSAAVVAFGVATEDITQLSVDYAVERALWWFIYLSVGFYLAAVAWIDFLTGTQTLQLELQRVVVRGVSAAVLLLLALFGGQLPAPWAVGAVAAVCALQVLFDLFVGRSAAEVAEST